MGTWPSRLGSLRWGNNYGYGLCATRTIEWLHCKLQTHHLIREGAPQKQDRNFHTATFRQKVVSCQMLQSGLDTKAYWLTVWPSAVKRLWLWQSVRSLRSESSQWNKFVELGMKNDCPGECQLGFSSHLVGQLASSQSENCGWVVVNYC
jgi:hypothetical protein